LLPQILRKRPQFIGNIRLPDLTGEWMNPYARLPTSDKRGKSNLTDWQGRSGIYFIKENRKIVYIGHSTTNLYKTITRHFQVWNDSAQEGRIWYNVQGKNSYRVKLHEYEPDEAQEVECALIQKYQPRDNKMKLQSCNSAEENEQLKRELAEMDNGFEIIGDVPF
ncbi:MAG: GIY-YIG nuclease family protein, partial [Bacteroidota bacterium]